MTPARMKRNVERQDTPRASVAITRRGRIIETGSSTRKFGSRSPERQQTVSPLSDGSGVEKRPCGGLRRHDQYFSSGRPDVLKIFGLGRLRRVVAGGLLGGDFDMRVGRHQFVGNRNPLDDLDALAHQRVVLHVAHRNEAVDPANAKPMQHVRHELLEARVLHTGDAFGALEVGRRGVAAFLALARVINQELGDLAERAAFLAIVNDDAELALLGGARALLNAVDQIRPAGADVGAEHVRAIALVVHAAGDLGARIGQLRDIAEQIGVMPPIGGRNTRMSGRVTSSGKMPAVCSNRLRRSCVSVVPKPLRDAGQIPDRIDRDLDDRKAAVGMDGVAVRLQPAGGQRIAHLDQIEPRARDRNGRPDVEALGDLRR